MSLLLGLDQLEIAPDDRSKTSDECAQEPEYCIDSGVIRFEVDNVSTLDEDGRDSPEIEVGGLPWRLNVCKSEDEGEFLASYLYIQDNKSRLWSIDVIGSLMLFNSDPSKNVMHKLDKDTLKYNRNNCGRGNLLAWNDLMDEEKGFIKDNKITVEIRFKIVDFEGYRFRKFIFTDDGYEAHDVELVIDRKKVYVSKQILAIHSPVFNAMFYGNFDEKDKKEVELKGVDFEAFIELLNLIYHLYHKFTDANVECILSMADRFQIQSVIDQVEQFLINSSSMPVPSKLKLSNTYRLVKLQEHCLEWFESNKRLMNQQDIDSFIAENIVKSETTTQIDFTDANDPRHDVAIEFNEGEKIYACKWYICFLFTFYGELRDGIYRDSKEINITEFDREEFLEMLRVIYATGQKITDENVKFLAKLGDRYRINYLLDLIESHLISSSNLGLATKLLLSDQCKLINLQVHCFNEVRNWDDMDDIKESDEYDELSDATQAALLEETFRFPR